MNTLLRAQGVLGIAIKMLYIIIVKVENTPR